MRHRIAAAVLSLLGSLGIASALAGCTAVTAWAQPLGTTIPADCVAHTSFNGRPDVPGDYRCAGLALAFHTGGSARSPYPLWAGQWLFTDEDGQFRVGSCTFNRGTHPTIASRSHPVTQSFPHDPSGAKSAYLTWRYGDTADPLTAAAVWAVLHYYAQDAAGSNRSDVDTAPLVPRLDALAAESGRDDLQSLAERLDREAVAMSGEWQLSVAVTTDGVVTATLRSGSTPVPGRSITVLVSGSDDPLAATTGTDGTATVTVSLPSGTVTVAATAAAPGPVAVYRGVAADPGPYGAQTLATGGQPRVVRATTSIDVAPPPTEPTTTEAATTTTTEAPTTTEAATTTTTEAPATTTEPTTTAAPATEPATTSSPVPVGTPLPRTGPGSPSVAYLATALLVGGIGLLGSIRRRGHGAYTRRGDTG